MTNRRTKSVAIAGVALMCLTSATIAALPAHAENQPRMEQEIALLIQACEHLQKASHDKRGHRVKAINQINKAITQVRKGISFDNRN